MRAWFGLFFRSIGLFRRRSSSREKLGRAGERLAARYLRRLGYTIVAERYRCVRGELDLVAVTPDRTVVFVEVKTRRGDSTIQPGAAVTAEKQRRVIRAAWQFRTEHRIKQHPVRYDVVAVTWPCEGGEPVVVHEQGAFSDPPRGYG